MKIGPFYLRLTRNLPAQSNPHILVVDLNIVITTLIQKCKELDDLQVDMEHKVQMLAFDVANGDKQTTHFKELLDEQQTKEQNRKNDIERYITAAREAMERERQDRYLLLVEQNKLKHKVEKLSENCKSYQVMADFSIHIAFCYLLTFCGFS